jgi:hypothetical protein
MEWLDKNVNNLILRRDESNLQLLLRNTLTEKVEINFNMLRLCMKDWVGQQICCTNIVAP